MTGSRRRSYFRLFFGVSHPSSLFSFFFFNDTATTEIYTLSLHDALPIYWPVRPPLSLVQHLSERLQPPFAHLDRKSTRLNSSHGYISYAVFCLKKKKTTTSNLLSFRMPRSLSAPHPTTSSICCLTSLPPS